MKQRFSVYTLIHNYVGWIAKLEAKDTSELDSLMTSDQYETYLSKSEV